MRILLILLLVNIKITSYADWFNGADIDYWGENKKIKIDSNQQNKLKNNNIVSFNSEIRAKDKEKFDWNNYNNPSNIEFFDDGGDFVPNRPWREVLANPTKENVKKYVDWQARKITISNEVSKLIAENAEIPTPLSQQPSLDINKLSKNNNIVNENKIKWQTLQILYFYKTKCVYCEKSIPTVDALKNRNILFIPVQLDWKESYPIYKESVNYDEKLQKVYQIRGTPTWIIRRSDIINSEPLIIEGYVNTASMENAIKRLF